MGVGWLFLLATICYALTALLPGSSVETSLGVQATEQTLANARQALELDRPHWYQFLQWIRNPLGATSEVWERPAGAIIAERAPLSLALALSALLLSVLLGGVLGMLLVRYPHRRGQNVGASLISAWVAVPNFWLATILIWFFAVKLGWLPSGGVGEDGSSLLPYLVLPALALALPQSALFAMLLRSAVEGELQHPAGRTFRSMGASHRWVRWHVALPVAIAPLASVVGMQLAVFAAGAVVIENVFALPGVGRLILQAAEGRDHTLLRSVLLVITVFVMGISATVTMLLRRWDWRNH